MTLLNLILKNLSGTNNWEDIKTFILNRLDPNKNISEESKIKILNGAKQVLSGLHMILNGLADILIALGDPETWNFKNS